jgi:hypothetical protein
MGLTEVKVGDFEFKELGTELIASIVALIEFLVLAINNMVR